MRDNHERFNMAYLSHTHTVHMWLYACMRACFCLLCSACLFSWVGQVLSTGSSGRLALMWAVLPMTAYRGCTDMTVRVQEDSSKQTHKTNWIWSRLLMKSVNIKALSVIMMRTHSDKTLLDSFCGFNVVMVQAVHAACLLFSFSLVFFIKSLQIHMHV